jgi:hypothetical protein
MFVLSYTPIVCNNNSSMLFIWKTIIGIFKYTTEFVTNIPIIKDICEVINDILIIIKCLLLLQIGPKTWATLFFYLKYLLL